MMILLKMIDEYKKNDSCNNNNLSKLQKAVKGIRLSEQLLRMIKTLQNIYNKKKLVEWLGQNIYNEFTRPIYSWNNYDGNFRSHLLVISF